MSLYVIKLLVGGGLAVSLMVGLYSWHRSIVRAEAQKVEAETRTTVEKDLAAQHALETKAREERIAELEQRVVDLARNRAASTQRVEIITKQAETAREEIKTLDTDAVRAAIRQRLRAGAATTAPQP